MEREKDDFLGCPNWRLIWQFRYFPETKTAERVVQLVEPPDALEWHDLPFVDEVIESAAGQRWGEKAPDDFRTHAKFRVVGGFFFSVDVLRIAPSRMTPGRALK
jgi:hypothetical protein